MKCEIETLYSEISTVQTIQSMARLPGLGRTAGAAPYVAIAVGIISGQYIFNQPLKDYVAKQPKPPN